MSFRLFLSIAFLPVRHRPDVQAARSRAAAMLQRRASRWQDLGAGLSYSRERTKDEPEPVETEHIAGLKLSIPLPIWNDDSGRIREAEAAAIRVAKEVDATTLIAEAEALSARANYSAGLTALPEVLRARARRLQRQRLDALRDYQLARSSTATFK